MTTMPQDDQARQEPGAGPEVLDGVMTQPPAAPPDLKNWRRIAADPERSLAERLEAFDDLIDSEVGDTTLSRARNIERQYGFRQLFLKFEGGNPSGTQKDRIAFAQTVDALRRGFESVTAATCGNYGVALALAASTAGLRCRLFIPASYQARRIPEIQKLGAEIIRTDGDYETAVLQSQRQASAEEIYDANPGGINTTIQLTAYGQIAYEIYDELRDAPAVVAVPVSNGTTLAGIYRGFVSLYRRGKTSRLPRMVAGSAFRKNPIVGAWLKNLARCEDLDPVRIRESSINEPLVNWHAIDGDEGLQAIRATDGWAGYASDRAMSSTARSIRENEGLNVLPASTAGLNVLLERHAVAPLPGDRYVAVLTGRR